MKKLAWLFLTLFCSSAAWGQRSVLTYHYDNFRTGQNTEETILTPSNVNPNQFRWLFAHPVDGQIYGQPLYVPNLNIPGRGMHNVVFVATEGDTVYAFDADTRGANVRGPLWSASLIDTAHGAAAGATTVSTSGSNPDINCGDLTPSVGITSTPVIDPATGTIYVEAKSKENGGFVHRLHALDITSGNEKPSWPVVITATVSGAGGGNAGGLLTFDSLHQMNRPGLLLSNGTVYVAFASHCDIDPYHGWVFGYDVATRALKGVFVTTPNGQRGGIWMSGAGLAADPSDNVFAATGNGDFDNATNFGDSILKLHGGSLGLMDSFTPSNQSNLNNGDLDLGSGGVLLLPDQSGSHPHLLVQAGKKGSIYLVDRDHMGGYCNGCTGNPQIVQQLMGAVGQVFSMPAYWNKTVYFWGAGDKLKAFSLNNGLLSTSPIAVSAESYGFPGANLSISANGNTNGIVWSLRTDAYNSGPPGAEGSAVLQAHDAVSLALLYSSDWNSARDAPGPAVKFTVPVVANGKVYVGTDSYLSVYGLGASPSPNGAVSVNVPATMVTGQPYTATFTVSNTGNVAWSPIGSGCNAFLLGSQNPQDNTTWGGRLALPNAVAPGESATFSTTVTAPSAPGVYNFQWKMLQECVAWFGMPSTNVSILVTPPPTGTKNGTVSASVPATMIVGQQYAATFTVTNTGTADWNFVGPYCNAFRLGALNPADNAIWGAARWELPSTVPAPGSLTWSTTFTAPTTPGVYNFQWGMLQECVTWFGSPSNNIAVAVNALPSGPPSGVRDISDFNHDGKTDFLWQYSDGSVTDWLMNGSTIISSQYIMNSPIPGWTIVGTGDFNADGQIDIVWQYTNGMVVVWYMNGNSYVSSAYVYAQPLPGWTVRGVADFNGDGWPDLLLQAQDGSVVVWYMKGLTVQGSASVSGPQPGWTVRATGDFNGDGKPDILWENPNAGVTLWLMNGATMASWQYLINGPIAGWTIVGTGDFNGDSKTDILWQYQDGSVAAWYMNGTTFVSSAYISSQPIPGWTLRYSK